MLQEGAVAGCDGQSPGVRERVKLSRAEQSRINGAKSRGPKSPAGKTASRRSPASPDAAESAEADEADEPAVHCCLMPTDDPAELRAFIDDLMDELQPTGRLQRSLVERIAQTQWRLRQLPLLEELMLQVRAEEAERKHWLYGLMAEILGDIDGGVLDGVRVYERRLERSLGRCLRQLRMVKATGKSGAATTSA